MNVFNMYKVYLIVSCRSSVVVSQHHVHSPLSGLLLLTEVKLYHFVRFERFAGQCLNFNCAFILVLMLRQCITFLRTRGFTTILPLDQHIYLHKLTGVLVAAYSLLHTIMHLFNFSKFCISKTSLYN